MTTVKEVLRLFRADLTESDIADGLAAALRRVPGVSSTALTTAEAKYLALNAGPGVAEQIVAWVPAEEHRQRVEAAVDQVTRLAGSTLSIEQTASLIGVDRSRISHRLSAGQLYALNIGGRRRIPTWQFYNGRELPGLGDVVAAIEPGMHPASVDGLMATPQDELDGQTPIQHLISGGNPAAVAALIADLGRW